MKTVPFNSVTFVDKNLESGRLYLGSFAPKYGSVIALFMRINSNTGGELYNDFVDAYETIWEQAEKWHPN